MNTKDTIKDPLAVPTQTPNPAPVSTAAPAGELPFQTYERVTGQKWGTPEQMAPILTGHGITAAPGSAEANLALQQKLIAQPTGAPATGAPTVPTGTPAPETAQGKAPTGAAPTDTDKAATSVADMIKLAANPTGKGLEYVTKDSTEVAQYSMEKSQALEKEKAATLERYNQLEAEENRKNENDAKQLIGTTNNRLAELGILDTSTAGVQYMNDIQSDINEINRTTASKYAIMRLDLDAKVKNSLLEAVNTQIKDINDRVKTRIDQLQKGADIAGNFYKTLSDQEIAQEKNKLDRERLAVDEAYNKGRLSIDAYKAEIDRIKNEKDAMIRSRQVDINAFQAETGRMKANAEIGTPRIPFDQWAKEEGARRGQTLDISSPQVRAQYYQQNPVTLKALQKSLDTEQATRKEVVQDMVDKGEITLEQAQMIHPDIAPLIRRKGASQLEKMMYDLASFSSTSAPEQQASASTEPEEAAPTAY